MGHIPSFPHAQTLPYRYTDTGSLGECQQEPPLVVARPYHTFPFQSNRPPMGVRLLNVGEKLGILPPVSPRSEGAQPRQDTLESEATSAPGSDELPATWQEALWREYHRLGYILTVRTYRALVTLERLDDPRCKRGTGCRDCWLYRKLANDFPPMTPMPADSPWLLAAGEGNLPGQARYNEQMVDRAGLPPLHQLPFTLMLQLLDHAAMAKLVLCLGMEYVGIRDRDGCLMIRKALETGFECFVARWCVENRDYKGRVMNYLQDNGQVGIRAKIAQPRSRVCLTDLTLLGIDLPYYKLRVEEEWDDDVHVKRGWTVMPPAGAPLDPDEDSESDEECRSVAESWLRMAEERGHILQDWEEEVDTCSICVSDHAEEEAAEANACPAPSFHDFGAPTPREANVESWVQHLEDEAKKYPARGLTPDDEEYSSEVDDSDFSQYLTQSQTLPELPGSLPLPSLPGHFMGPEESFIARLRRGQDVARRMGFELSTGQVANAINWDGPFDYKEFIRTVVAIHGGLGAGSSSNIS